MSVALALLTYLHWHINLIHCLKLTAQTLHEAITRHSGLYQIKFVTERLMWALAASCASIPPLL